jgi:hypothetical protein
MTEKLNKIKTMKINRTILMTACLSVGSILILAGAFFVISHWRGGHILMILGLLVMALYTILMLKKK